MNEIITVLELGALAILVLLGFKVLDRNMKLEFRKLKRSVAKSNHLEHEKTKKYIKDDGKLTRKEQQETKTRLTQVKKDLNTIEKATKKKKVKKVK